MSWNEHRSVGPRSQEAPASRRERAPKGATPRRRRAGLAWARAGLAAGVVAAALACGDSFPNMFLLRGDEVVLTASPMSFQALVEPLVPKSVGTLVALPAARYEFISKQQDDGADIAAARAAGARSLAEFDLYQEGRSAYARHDLRAARAAWERLLSLSEGERRWRSVWAAYMLGRSWHSEDPARAAQCYARTRELAAQGFADSLGLATASIGWDGRLAYERRDLVRAVALYLEQAAAKDPTAVLSLWRCGNRVHQLDDAGLDAIARDPMARRVVTAWIVSANPREDYVFSAATVRPATIGVRWLAAIERAGAVDVAFADIVAWGAYQAGDFERAAKWAERAGENSPRANWVRSKLALRRGEVGEAATRLAKSVRAMPTDEELPAGSAGWGPDVRADRQQAAGEAGVLLLTTRQYEEAIDFFLEADEMREAAYIAERLLTTGELVALVDRRAPGRVSADESRRDRERALAHLLARRLVREGAPERARGYLPEPLQPVLARYVACLSTGRDAKRAKAERVRALVEAARIARHRGLELMGTELGPDSASTNGGFGEPDMLALRKDLEDARLVGVQPEEQRRAEATALRPWRRFHYRYVGCDLAWEAAALMPDGSPETAAILCEAGSWIKTLDPKHADRFYKALVNRCGATPLGRAADAARWFPALADADRAFAELMPMASGGNGSDADAVE